MKRLVIALALVALGSPVAHSDSPLEETRVTLRQHVLKLINHDRQLYNLPPVELDGQVSALADEYCKLQIRNGTTGHFTTDGRAPYMRYSLAGGRDGMSENAAAWSASYRFSDRALYEMARRSQDAMMAETSPRDGHKRTILDPNATHVGIGLAWEGGEFRMVHHFVRRYVDWTRALPSQATIGEQVTATGKPLAGTRIEAISVHHEAMPAAMPASVANAVEVYSLPDKRKDFLPRLKSSYTRRIDGTIAMVRREYSDGRRGDFYLADDGSFSFNVPFADGAGVYTIVVWVRKEGGQPIPASNISIIVDAPAEALRASAIGGGTR